MQTFFRLLGIFIFAVLLNSRCLAAKVNFYIDTSGSMANNKLKAAVEGAKLFVALADRSDTIQIVAFSRSAKQSPPFQMANPEAREDACKWLDGLHASGGTKYLNALKAVSIKSATVGVFLSDGEPSDDSAKILQFVDASMADRLRLHTIAVGCKIGTPAQLLLADMAARTTGSHARVDSSEALVRQFLRIAVQEGAYRGYEPETTNVELKAVAGRLMVFGFDGDIQTSRSVNGFGYSHHADMPGEKVSVAVFEPEKPTDIRLTLANQHGPNARLGTVYLDDLPTHRLVINNEQIQYAPADNLNLSLAFVNTDGSEIGELTDGASGQFELVDAKGQVIATAKAVNNQDRIEGVLKLLSMEGTYTVRATSNWPRGGKPFTQTTETIVVVKKPQRVDLVIVPSRLSGIIPLGSTTKTLTIKSPVSTTNGTVTSKEILGTADGLTIKTATIENNQIHLEITAKRPGTFKGHIDLGTRISGQQANCRLPLEITVLAPVTDHAPADHAPVVAITTAARVPVFAVEPASLKIDAAVDEVVRFRIAIKALPKNTGANKLTASFSSFDQQGNTVKTSTSVKWIDGKQTLRGPNSTLLLRASILCPSIAGQCSGKLTIRTESGYSVTIPISLDTE